MTFLMTKEHLRTRQLSILFKSPSLAPLVKALKVGRSALFPAVSTFSKPELCRPAISWLLKLQVICHKSCVIDNCLSVSTPVRLFSAVLFCFCLFGFLETPQNQTTDRRTPQGLFLNRSQQASECLAQAPSTSHKKSK